jgi:hypothetical protein
MKQRLAAYEQLRRAKDKKGQIVSYCLIERVGSRV